MLKDAFRKDQARLRAWPWNGQPKRPCLQTRCEAWAPLNNFSFFRFFFRAKLQWSRKNGKISVFWNHDGKRKRSEWIPVSSPWSILLELPCSEATRSIFRFFSRSSFKLPVPIAMFPNEPQHNHNTLKIYLPQCFRMNNNITTIPWRCTYHNCWLKHDGAASDWWSLLWGPQVRKTQRRHSYAFLSQPTHMSSDSENIFNQISDLKLYSAHVLQNGPREMFLITKTRQETICWN